VDRSRSEGVVVLVMSKRSRQKASVGLDHS
jgi:hypothetical protein